MKNAIINKAHEVIIVSSRKHQELLSDAIVAFEENTIRADALLDIIVSVAERNAMNSMRVEV